MEETIKAKTITENHKETIKAKQSIQNREETKLVQLCAYKRSKGKRRGDEKSLHENKWGFEGRIYISLKPYESI